MAEDKLSSYIDLAATQKETDALLAQMDLVVDKFGKLNEMKISLEGMSKTKDVVATAKAASAAMTELKEKVEDVKKADEDVVKATKEYIAATTQEAKANKEAAKSFEEILTWQVKVKEQLRALRKERDALRSAFDQGLISNEEFIESLKKIEGEEQGLKVTQNELNRALRNMEKEAQNTEGSLNKMRAQLNLSLQAFDRLSDEEKASDIGKQLKSNIDILTKSISQQEQSTGRFQRNVGNYSGALQTLRKALDDVTKKIEENTESGKDNAEVLEQLRKEEQLLQSLLNSQISGFASVSAEIKQNTVALQAMAAAGLEGSAAYQELFRQTAALKDEAQDLKDSLKNAVPDDALFKGAKEAAQGLVGIYGLAQSAAALFGEENEELQETMVKLQAAETALQSIEAIYNLTKKENAFRQAITIGLQKLEILQTKLQTAAESKNIVVKYAAIVAQKALNAVMAAASTPVGAVLLGLTALVALLSSFSTASDKAAKDFKQLNDEFKGGEALLNDRVSLIKRSGAVTQAELKKQFASEKQIREAQRKDLAAEGAEYKKFLAENGSAYKEAFDITESLTQRERAGKELSKKEKERLNDAITFVDTYMKVRDKSDDLENQLEVSKLENKRANIEEEAKLRQDSVELSRFELEARLQDQAKIVSNDEKSYGERLTALSRFTRLQRDLINADRKKELEDPTLANDPMRRSLIIKKAQYAIIAAEKEGQQQRNEILKEQAEREKAAQFEIAKTSMQVRADTVQAIADNANKDTVVRIDALKKGFEIQKAMIIAQRDFELSNTKLTASEKQVINDKARADEIALQRDFLEKTYQLSLQGLDKESQIAISNSQRRRSNYLKNLNEQFQDGIITKETFEKRAREADFRYANDELNTQINFLQQEIAKRKEHGEDVAALEAAVAKLREEQSSKTTDKLISDDERLFQSRIKKLESWRDLIANVFGTLNELVGMAADREIAQLDEQIAAIEKKKEKDLEYADKSISNEEKKAQAVAVIEARADAQREAAERKKRQVEAERARFEKLANISRIIMDTSLAVMTTLKDQTIVPGYLRIPLAATMAALGAAQLARVVATPIPKYADGTEDHPGGLAVVGDGGRRELVVTPDGKLMVTDKVPQVVDMPKHSVVLPDADQALQTILNSNNRTVSRLPYDHSSGNADLVAAYKRGTNQIVETIKAKKEISVNGTHAGVMMVHKHGQDYWNYINEQVNF